MSRLTLVVLVDALRHDYVARMPCLRALAAEGLVGRLREDFGFLPRAAYFGGLTPADSGFTNMYCCDPARSPFGAARGLPSSQAGREIEDALAIRQWAEADARRRVTPFVASYLSSAEIPLDLLPEFDLAERYAPWDARVGYRSLFADLAARGEAWFTCGWPETNDLADPSDRGLVRETLAAVRPPCRLAFLHLQALDGIGHAFGPESAELEAALAQTDALLAELWTALGARFDALDLVLFGDHGMVSVTGLTDVWAAIRSTGLEPGRDLVFFLDSTMARFWFRRPDARRLIVEALAPLPGRVLDGAARAALGIDRCDPRNGELYFLANPGVLILPNFFQRRGRPVRGMHGYHPDCPDNQGFFLSRPAGPSAPGALGVVGPTAIYAHTRRALGLPTAGPPASTPTPPRALVFTPHPDPAAERLVRRQLATLVEETRAALPTLQAIVLMGSFGRGEGGVMTDEDGALRPVNDYDVLVVVPETAEADLNGLGKTLAAQFGLDFVHFTRWAQIDPALPLSLAHFDLRYGHRVLWGDPATLETLPPYAAGDLAPMECVQLLMNRMAGLLTGLRGPFTAPAPLGVEERRYLRTQTMKALMALGDGYLMGWQAYACSYQTRLERLTWLAPGARLDADQLAAIQAAYEFKLHPDVAGPTDLVALAARTSRWLLEAFTAATARLVARQVGDPVGAARAYYALMTANAPAVFADNLWCVRMLTDAARPEPQGSVRQAIYAALPLLLAAAHGDRSAFEEAQARLDPCLSPPWPTGLTAANWDVARRKTADAWLTLVH